MRDCFIRQGKKWIWECCVVYVCADTQSGVQIQYLYSSLRAPLVQSMHRIEEIRWLLAVFEDVQTTGAQISLQCLDMAYF